MIEKTSANTIVEQTSNRLPWIDFLRGIAMICVMYWHCSCITEFSAITGGFFMPMFYALSGYLFNKRGGVKLWKLFKRIYLPLLIFWILPNIIGPIYRMNFNQLLIRCFHGLTQWFLPTFFASTVLFRLLVVYIKDKYFPFVISVFILFTGLVLTKYEWAADYYTTDICLSTILVGQCCIMLGYIWKQYESNHIINLKALRIVSTVSLCFFIILEFITEPGSYVDFHTNTYPNYPIGAGIVISSLLFGYSWARNVNFENVWIKPIVKAVCFFGKYAIFIFVLHHWVIDVLNKYVLGRIYPHVMQDPLNALIYSILTLWSCYIIISVLKRFAPFLLGEKRISTTKI